MEHNIKDLADATQEEENSTIEDYLAYVKYRKQKQKTRKPVAVELTSKKYKKWMLIGSLMFAFFTVCFAIIIPQFYVDTDLPRKTPSLFLVFCLSFSLLGIVLGLVIALTAQTCAWWNHG